MPNCIVPNCPNDARNNLGIRLRKPDSTAVWAPNANACVCDDHARSGARLTLIYEATDTGKVELRVQGATEGIRRRTVIR